MTIFRQREKELPMRTEKLVKAAVAGAAILILSQTVLAQAVTLRYKPLAGQRRFYERSVRTEVITSANNHVQRRVTEVPVLGRALAVETKADPPSMRLVVVDTPQGGRVLLYEEDGKDRLSAIPEASRQWMLPPVLFAQWRDLRGQPTEKPPNPTEPGQALDMIQAQMRFLPEQAVKPGDTWTRDIDLGAAKGSITTKYVANRTEGTTPCAILESSANVTFTGGPTERLKVERLTSRMAMALDGSGYVNQGGSFTLVEKADNSEQRVMRDFQEKTTDADQLQSAELDKARKDLAQIEKGLKEAQAGDIDTAIETLGAFVRENPQGAWTASVQALTTSLSNQRLLTKPVAAPRLRSMLRDLQAAHDRAGNQGNTPQLEQINQALRQIVTVNLKTIMEDSKDPDPVVRDLASFALAFAQGDEPAKRLLEMVKDENVEVRGSALISLAIQGRALDQKPLLALLQDSEPRVRGAAALVASRTMQRNDPRVAEVLPLLSENLKLTSPWTRMNTVSAVGALAPLGSVPVARALIDAYKAEKDERLKPHYLSVLKVLTGAEGNDAGPYEEWLKHPTTPPPPAPPAPKPETPPAPKPETPPAPKPETPPAPKPETPPAPKPETPPAPKPETPPAPKSETPPAPKPKG